MKAALIEVKFLPPDPSAPQEPHLPHNPGGFIYRVYDISGRNRSPHGAALRALCPCASGYISRQTDGAAALHRALIVANERGFTHYLPHGLAGEPWPIDA